ncbi:MAG: protein translocase subunit SecF [Desulfobacteraceae bacterium]|nr:protein translocase subunit SecF [Desulfobacteraceae bacterium]
MQLIKSDTKVDFLGKQKIGFIFSLILILISIGSLVYHKGPNYGIDFIGGTLIQVKFSQNVPIGDVRSGLLDLGLKDISVQGFGQPQDNEYLIRTSSAATMDNKLADSITGGIEKATGVKPEIRRVEVVGPQVGKDLKNKALLAVFYSLLFITIYISGRFEFKWALSGITAGSMMAVVYFLSIFNVSMPFVIAAALLVSLALFWALRLQYAMGAIVAIIHDIIITVGVFSLLNLDFSLSIIAALLTIIGYSLNDTIIIFDRIRENLKGTESKKSLAQLFNKSINDTLSRTLLTSFITLVVLFALFFFGGEIIHDFAFAMIVGIIIGTYSSIFVASPIVLATQHRR